MLLRLMWNRLLIIFLLLNASLVSAQLTFSGGIKAGLAATQVHGDNAQGFNKAGLSAGAFVQVNTSEKFGVRMELGYIGKGSRRPANPDNNDFETWGYNFRYIHVPVMCDINVGRFNVIGGIYGGYLISSSQVYNGNTFDIVNPEMSNIDLGGLIGAKMDLGDHIFFESRYSMSFIPIRPSPDSGNQVKWYDGGMTNIVLEIGMGYKF